MQPSNQALKRLRFYERQPRATQERIELFEQATWDFWSRKTWVKFVYLYCDNEFNRKAGRVGRISSTRIGTRNLDLIPTASKPKRRNPSSKTKRYFDVSRAGTTVTDGITSGGLPGKILSNAAQAGQWRSFRPDTFSIMVQIWSFERETWVDRLEDFTDRNPGTSSG